MTGSMRRRVKHDVFVLILVIILMLFAVVSALAWLALHLVVLAGVALLIGLAYHLGQRRRARPVIISSRPPRRQPVAPLPSAATAVPAAAELLPQADYDWDQPVTRQPASVPADRDSLLNTPMSGARSLWGPE